MRGFAERADVEEVESFLASRVRALPSEGVALLDCVGRVLAEDVAAAVDVPGFPRSAMDGYAVRGEDTFGASEYDAIPLEKHAHDLGTRFQDGGEPLSVEADVRRLFRAAES